MRFKDALWLALLMKALNWLIGNAQARIYTSPVPVGKHLGGHDILELKDSYVIFDCRVAGRIVILGYFQSS